MLHSILRVLIIPGSDNNYPTNVNHPYSFTIAGIGIFHLLGGEQKKPSADAAADLITLEPKVQVGRLSELQAFHTRVNMHNSIQICHPEVKK